MCSKDCWFVGFWGGFLVLYTFLLEDFLKIIMPNCVFQDYDFFLLQANFRLSLSAI